MTAGMRALWVAEFSRFMDGYDANDAVAIDAAAMRATELVEALRGYRALLDRPGEIVLDQIAVGEVGHTDVRAAIDDVLGVPR